jgi:hypothetical protein
LPRIVRAPQAALSLAPHVSHARHDIDSLRLPQRNNRLLDRLGPPLTLEPVQDRLRDEPGERREYMGFSQALLLGAVEADGVH